MASGETARYLGQRQAPPAADPYRVGAGVWLTAIAPLLPADTALPAAVALSAWRWARWPMPHPIRAAVGISLATGLASAFMHAITPTIAASWSGPALVTAGLSAALVATAPLLTTVGPNTRAWGLAGTAVADSLLGVTVAAGYRTTPAAVLFTLPVAVAASRHRALLAAALAEARTDPKTGVTTYRWWARQAAGELARAARYRRPAAVLLIDADHFKQVNDRYGHLTGDAVLAHLASQITTGLRAYDTTARPRRPLGDPGRAPGTVGRFGGEEFVVLLPGAGPAQALRAAERLRHRAATHPTAVTTPTGQRLVVTVTVSIGVAAYPTHGGDLKTVLDAADAALYEAKRAGRDRVAEPPERA